MGELEVCYRRDVSSSFVPVLMNKEYIQNLYMKICEINESGKKWLGEQQVCYGRDVSSSFISVLMNKEYVQNLWIKKIGSEWKRVCENGKSGWMR